MTTVFPPPPPTVVPVAGTAALFPVRRIFCVGQNYAAHAREMGTDPTRTDPCFFSKPADVVVADGSAVPYPPMTANLHYEIELVVALGSGGAAIPVAAALGHVFGYAAGIDLTRRDLQAAAKKAGQPWDMAKGFDRSAPLGAIAPASAIGHPAGGGIRLRLNGVLRQEGDLSDMIWSVAEIIAKLSCYVELKAGDLIFTGTPEGVGPVVAGDRLEGSIEGVGTVSACLSG
ncbi:MAG: fumarylacetoacetate hydrolase family protein [Rhodospirillaceae bacterium]